MLFISCRDAGDVKTRELSSVLHVASSPADFALAGVRADTRARLEETLRAWLLHQGRREEGAASTADLATEEDAQAQEEMAAARFELAGFGGSKKNN